MASKTAVLDMPPYSYKRAVPGPCLPGYKYPKMRKHDGYRTWSAGAAKMLREMDLGPPFTGYVAVMTLFLTEKPRTSKLLVPNMDNDNLEKAAWDAMTQSGVFWTDDNLIMDNATGKRFVPNGIPSQIIIHVSEVDPWRL